MELDILATAAVCALALGFGHYFRWDGLFGKHLRDIHPVFPYVYGVLSIAVPISLWMAESEYWTPLLVLWTTIIAGGLTVLLCYWYDSSTEARRGRREAEEREALARKQQERWDDQRLA